MIRPALANIRREAVARGVTVVQIADPKTPWQLVKGTTPIGAFKSLRELAEALEEQEPIHRRVYGYLRRDMRA